MGMSMYVHKHKHTLFLVQHDTYIITTTTITHTHSHSTHPTDFFITAINSSVQHVALCICAAYIISFLLFAVIWWGVVLYVVMLGV